MIRALRGRFPWSRGEKKTDRAGGPKGGKTKKGAVTPRPPKKKDASSYEHEKRALGMIAKAERKRRGNGNCPVERPSLTRREKASTRKKKRGRGYVSRDPGEKKNKNTDGLLAYPTKKEIPRSKKKRPVPVTGEQKRAQRSAVAGRKSLVFGEKKERCALVDVKKKRRGTRPVTA